MKYASEVMSAIDGFMVGNRPGIQPIDDGDISQLSLLIENYTSKGHYEKLKLKYEFKPLDGYKHRFTVTDRSIELIQITFAGIDNTLMELSCLVPKEKIAEPYAALCT